MVIQRWQSVLLFIAALCMAFSCYTPIATIPGDTVVTVVPIDFVAYFTLNALVTLLLLVAIFMYKNMKRQITLTTVSILLIVVAIAVRVLLGFMAIEGGEPALMGYALPICAFIAACFALSRIKADQRLLRSADRLR